MASTCRPLDTLAASDPNQTACPFCPCGPSCCYHFPTFCTPGSFSIWLVCDHRYWCPLAQVSSCVLQQNGSIPGSLLFLLLEHLIGQLESLQLPPPAVQMSIAALLDQAMLVMPVPVKADSSWSPDSSSPQAAEGLTEEAVRLWDLNCPPPEAAEKDAFTLQLEEASITLVQLVPSSISHMTEAVRARLRCMPQSMLPITPLLLFLLVVQNVNEPCDSTGSCCCVGYTVSDSAWLRIQGHTHIHKHTNLQMIRDSVYYPFVA